MLHHLTIPVDIPPMDVVTTARLRLHLDNPKAADEPRVVTVGQAIQAELTVTHTRQWSSPNQTDSIEELDFCYELHADPEDWLLGGQKKCHFTSRVRKPERQNLALVSFCLPRG